MNPCCPLCGKLMVPSETFAGFDDWFECINPDCSKPKMRKPAKAERKKRAKETLGELKDKIEALEAEKKRFIDEAKRGLDFLAGLYHGFEGEPVKHTLSYVPRLRIKVKKAEKLVEELRSQLLRKGRGPYPEMARVLREQDGLIARLEEDLEAAAAHMTSYVKALREAQDYIQTLINCSRCGEVINDKRYCEVCSPIRDLPLPKEREE